MMDEDVELLEREIENVIMRKGGTAIGSKRDRLDHNIVNMTTSNFEGKRVYTANAPEGGKRRKIPKHQSMTTSKEGGIGGISGKPQRTMKLRTNVTTKSIK